jgi:hypothetical protein
MSNLINLNSIQVAGIDMDDAFDFCDAFASSGEFEDGTPLTDQNLEDFTDSDLGRSLIHRLACEECFC